MTRARVGLRLGVTGHRTLHDPDAVGALVDDLLDGLGSTGTVVSSLAEGADRLVAERALARPGWSLAVVLPFEPLEYGDDFATVSSRNEFDDLLAEAAEVEEVPAQPTRVEAYLAAGRRVLVSCDVLVAVWDGQPARGGTAEIVAEARAVGRPLAWIEVGPVEAPDGRVPVLVKERWPWVS